MNFQNDILHLEDAFEVLKLQASSTSENWKDSVRLKFYDQFIYPLFKEFSNYRESLYKLDKSFEEAELQIKSLID